MGGWKRLGQRVCCERICSSARWIYSGTRTVESVARDATESPISLAFFESFDAAHGPIQKVLFAFFRFKKDGSTDGNRAQQRDRHEFTSRKDPIHVIHVDGNKFQVWSFFGEVIKSTFELSHFAVDGAASFGEHDQRVGVSDFTEHQFDGALVDLDLLAIDQNGVERLGQETSQRGLSPVVLGSNRPSQLPQTTRESRPEDDRVKVAGVVGEIDPLAGVRFGSDPAH